MLIKTTVIMIRYLKCYNEPNVSLNAVIKIFKFYQKILLTTVMRMYELVLIHNYWCGRYLILVWNISYVHVVFQTTSPSNVLQSPSGPSAAEDFQRTHLEEPSPTLRKFDLVSNSNGETRITVVPFSGHTVTDYQFFHRTYRYNILVLYDVRVSWFHKVWFKNWMRQPLHFRLCVYFSLPSAGPSREWRFMTGRVSRPGRNCIFARAVRRIRFHLSRTESRIQNNYVGLVFLCGSRREFELWSS